jgi:hypothetical protein
MWLRQILNVGLNWLEANNWRLRIEYLRLSCESNFVYMMWVNVSKLYTIYSSLLNNIANLERVSNFRFVDSFI